jgi:hypothetical protein
MKTKSRGLASILIKKVQPTLNESLSSAVKKILEQLVGTDVTPAINQEMEMWIDFRCTRDEFELVKARFQTEMKQFKVIEPSISFSDRD